MGWGAVRGVVGRHCRVKCTRFGLVDEEVEMELII